MPAGPGFTSMNVSLPTEQKAFIDRRVKAGGFRSVIESPRSKTTTADWKEVRESLIERHKRGRRT